MASTLGEAFENLRDMVDTCRPYAVAYNETLEKLKKNEVQISKNICNLVNNGQFSAAKDKTAEHKILCDVIELMETSLYNAQYEERRTKNEQRDG